MCSNYDPEKNVDEMQRLFGLTRTMAYQPRAGEVWPTGLAPFIRLALDGSGERILEEGHFGLLPHFATQIAFGRKTYNARSETVANKPSFRDAWRKGYRCIIPARAVYEPNYETGKAVRWRISGGIYSMLAIAGIYSPWTDADGVSRGTFAMLTVNADGHPVYSQFHAPGDEKRMVVILEHDDIDRWLTCTPEEAKAFFKQYQGHLEATPAPLPARTPRSP
jgi:putative SOS response-associated peptidase YedK